MKTNNFVMSYLIGLEKRDMNVIQFEPDDLNNVKAIVQIAHSITEHMGRYQELAKNLTDNGIIVVGMDLPGYGSNRTGTIPSFGEHGWNSTVNFMYLINRRMTTVYPCIPIYLIGFSLGSLLVREFVQSFREKINGAIIIGTTAQPNFTLKLAEKMTDKEITKCGWNGTTPKIEDYALCQYNKTIKEPQTQYDWLCSDREEVEKYIADDNCIKDVSAGLYHDMLQSMQKLNQKNNIRYIQNFPRLKILFINGEEDPVNHGGKDIKKIYNEYKNNENFAFVSFPGRHDVLHEKENGTSEKAIKTINGWLNKNIEEYQRLLVEGIY